MEVKHIAHFVTFWQKLIVISPPLPRHTHPKRKVGRNNQINLGHDLRSAHAQNGPIRWQMAKFGPIRRQEA